MKKRILGIFTALALCLVLLPATALATGGIEYLDADGVKQTYTGEYTVVAGSESMVKWGENDKDTWYVVDNNVTISPSTNYAVEVRGNVHLILKDGCTLTTTDSICVYGSLTIYAQSTDKETMGKLIATGKSYSRPGIYNWSSQSSITINGGYIQATGGSALSSSTSSDAGAAGIGGRGGFISSASNNTYGCSGGIITINGGYIEAKGGTGGNGFADYGGAGIGGGGGGTANGTTVSGGSGGNITINGGTIIANGGTGAAGIGGGGSGAGSNKDGSITINGGTVTAEGGKYAAGIGGGNKGNGGTINIKGGTVNATGVNGAGIGGGYHADGGTINISGGTVTAEGTGYGAGIGGGDASGSGTPVGGNGGNITISGGDVKASSTERGAGIGGGCDGAGGTINITGGTVKATPGVYAAGIGGGQDGDGGTINIGGNAYVEATGGSHSAGIGGGNGSSGNTINITGGTVKATGGGRGAGIGGGSYGSGGAITISGSANIEATGGADYVCGAGIGGGSYGAGGTIKIEGGTVKATGASSDYGSAGIGGGTDGSSGTITISGGTVTATGKGGSAGIGGGNGSYNKDGGAAETITISGGTVTANGTGGAAGIGGGKGYSGKADGAPGTFATTNSSKAIIKASSIADNDDKTGWSGIIFDGSDGGVYGSQTLSSAFKVESTENLLIAENATLNTSGKLTNSGNIYVDGTLTGAVSGSGKVYYRLILENCTASSGTTTYSGNTYAAEGATVKLTATFPNPNNQFVRSWVADPQVGTGGGNYYDIYMPAYAVTVMANIEDALTINTQPQDVTITYGEQTTLSVDVSRNSFISTSFQLSYQWYENDAEIPGATSGSYTTPTDLSVGSHTYTCKITCGNYNVTSNPATVTVGKAAPALTAPTANTLTYNGDNQTLVTAGTATGGTMQYALSQDGTYSETIPTGKDAGTYTVWYYVKGDDNHSGSDPDSVSVTISKATPTGTPTYTAITTSGKTLGDAALTKNAGWPEGTLKWVQADGITDLDSGAEVVANTSYKWLFTPTYENNYNKLTGSITPYVVSYSGGGSSGGGSSSGSGSSTTTNPDGSSTTTTTDKTTGAVTETTTSKPVTDAAGNTTQTTTETVTNKDGSKTETKTEVKTDANGVTTSTETVKATDTTGTTAEKVTETNAAGETTTTVAAAVSDKAVTAAAESGAPVTLPVEVTATTSAETAPVVKVEVPATVSEVKVEVPVENVTPGTVVVIVREDGTEEIVKATTMGENGVVVPLDGSATVKIVDNSKTFDDVAAADWESDAVAFVSAREIFNGTGDATFDPDVDMTRGMMVTVLARYAGANTEGGEAWYDKGLDWAKENNVSDGSDPTGKLTREQMAVMLYRYAGSPDIGGQELNFPDARNVSDFAADAMNWAVESGLINGMDGNLNPQGYATRAQLAAILMRFCQNVAQ